MSYLPNICTGLSASCSTARRRERIAITPMTPLNRLEERSRAWGVVVEDTLETPGSLVAFGTRRSQPVVLKVVRQPGDEWCCGEVLAAFDGKGTVRVYEYTEGAVLLERLSPGTSLASIALAGRDKEAIEILARVIKSIGRADEAPANETNPGEAKTFSTVEDWGKGFEHYLTSGDRQIPQRLVVQGQALYLGLCASQKATRLLHGDLQHYNILFDSQRGWTAIDPKGVIGELEYEIGAALRNPCDTPELLSNPQTIELRLKSFEFDLQLNGKRMLEWGFAQAVLSAIWTFEDGGRVDKNNPAIRLANAMQPMLE